MMQFFSAVLVYGDPSRRLRPVQSIRFGSDTALKPASLDPEDGAELWRLTFPQGGLLVVA